MVTSSTNTQASPIAQVRIQLIVGAVIVAIIGVVWLSQVWRSRNWPVVTATLSDVQTVDCKRACGSAKKLVYATVEFDRPASSGQVSSSRSRCRVENYNIARGDDKLVAPKAVQVAVKPDSCDDWRLVTPD